MVGILLGELSVKLTVLDQQVEKSTKVKSSIFVIFLPFQATKIAKFQHRGEARLRGSCDNREVCEIRQEISVFDVEKEVL